MLKKLIIDKYKVQSNGADGGHNYILTEIEHEGKKRKLVILFADKCYERDLKDNVPIQINGQLEDEGENFDLIMRNTTLEK